MHVNSVLYYKKLVKYVCMFNRLVSWEKKKVLKLSMTPKWALFT